ncbi:MAG: THUMP domain-containing protein [Planctomycetota bacterium]
MPRYFATCARGLERILADELRVLAADDIEQDKGGVHFAGDFALLYRANLWLRTPIRILVPILEAPVHSTDELYAAVKNYNWERHMTPDHTLAVDSNVRDSAITHSKFAALRVKDAICDQFLERCRRRPSVDVENPMVPLNLHIANDFMTLSLDSSGDSLHRRGYRPIQTKAPINESLGAGIVLMTGWRGECPLVDPMCGSGTLCIEAAWLALGRPPGLTRRRFGFMGWLNYDVKLWTKIRDAARDNARTALAHPIFGDDIRHDAIAFAEGNAGAAGIGNLLTFTRADIRTFTPPPGPPGVIVSNPPYGERIGGDDDLPETYRALGDAIRRSPGWRAFIFASREAPTRAMGIKPIKRTSLFNGKIHCELMEFAPVPQGSSS